MANEEITSMNIECSNRGEDREFGHYREMTMTRATPFLAEAQTPPPPAIPPPTHGQLWPRGVYPD